MEVGGYDKETDWPKMGPSLLIATCLILAIRTAKWQPNADASLSGIDLEKEIEYSAHLASRVMAALVSRRASIFPTKKVPWYQPGDEDSPK